MNLKRRKKNLKANPSTKKRDKKKLKMFEPLIRERETRKKLQDIFKDLVLRFGKPSIYIYWDISGSAGKGSETLTSMGDVPGK